MNTLFAFAPLTAAAVSADSIYNAEFTLSPANLPSFPTNGGNLFIEIARQYVASESETVRVHGVELLYPARFEP
jgi:hypothetical protein